MIPSARAIKYKLEMGDKAAGLVICAGGSLKDNIVEIALISL